MISLSLIKISVQLAIVRVRIKFAADYCAFVKMKVHQLLLPLTSFLLTFLSTHTNQYSTMPSSTSPVLHNMDLVANYGALKGNRRASDAHTDDDDETHASFAESVQLLIASALDFPGENCSLASVQGGTTTMPNQTFNLIKNIVGCGVLALPNGV